MTGHFTFVPGKPTEPGWIPFTALYQPETLTSVIGDAGAMTGDANRTVTASLLASAVSALVASPLTAALLMERRAVRLEPEHLWLHPAAGGFDAFATDQIHMAVLPDDPLIFLAEQPRTDQIPDDPAAVGQVLADRAMVSHTPPTTPPCEQAVVARSEIVPDLDALRRWLIDGYIALLEPFLEQVRVQSRRGRRALWADAGDRLATYLLLTGRLLGDPAAGRAEADALLAAAPPPLGHRVAWIEFEHQGQPVTWKRRSVCCLAYQAPRWQGQYCSTCPMLPLEETIRRTCDWFDTQPD